jgi:hypothetical protein
MKKSTIILLFGAALSLSACSKPAEETTNVADSANAIDLNASEESAGNFESDVNSTSLDEAGNVTETGNVTNSN